MSINGTPVNSAPVDDYSESISSIGDWLNGLPVDGQEINGNESIPAIITGGINSFAINTLVPVDGDVPPEEAFTPVSMPAGDICIISQLVGKVQIGDIIALEQNVSLQLSYVGNICYIVNEVINTQVGNICSIANYVYNPATPDFFARNGWRPDIWVGNVLITDDMLLGELIIHKAEAEANLAEFTIYTTNPVSFLDNVDNGSAPVIINYNNGSTVYRLFTGIVDMPEIDLINRRVKLKCSNDRDKLVESNMQPYLADVGSYSPEVQGSLSIVSNLAPPRQGTVSQELAYRLQTTPSSVDFDSYNNININSWYAKDVADYQLTADSVYYRKPSVQWQQRSNVINSHQIYFTYQYTRLYHYDRPFSWTSPYLTDAAAFHADAPSLPTISMIQSAITTANWKKTSDGHYTAESLYVGTAFGSLTGTTPNEAQVSFPLIDDNGDFVLDASGNQLYSPTGNAAQATGVLPSATTESTKVLSATWNAAIQFSQFISQNYTFYVNATQSMAQNGTLQSYTTASMTDSYDASAWEAYKYTTPLPFTPNPWKAATSYNNGDIVGTLAPQMWQANGDYLEGDTITAPAAPFWTANTNYAAGQKVMDPNGNSNFVYVSSGGISGAAQPVFPVADGGTVDEFVSYSVSGTNIGVTMRWTAEVFDAEYLTYTALNTGTTGNNQPVFPTGALGQTVQDGSITWSVTSLNGAGALYICITSGVSGNVTPSWPPTVGTTVVDNTVTWRVESPAREGAAVQIGQSYYYDQFDLIPGRLENAYQTALNIAKTAILATHRGTQVEVEVPLIPDLEIRHTMQITDADTNQAHLTCKGRVTKIEHSFALDEGHLPSTKVTLSLFRSLGEGSDTPLASPPPLIYNPNITGSAVILGNHYGQNPAGFTGSSSWSGYAGNKVIASVPGAFGGNEIISTAFTPTFTVITPSVVTELRKQANVGNTVTYNMSIPNDLFEIDLTW